MTSFRLLYYYLHLGKLSRRSVATTNSIIDGRVVPYIYIYTYKGVLHDIFIYIYNVSRPPCSFLVWPSSPSKPSP